MTRYWFKPKRYGYGATPVTWQGWAVTIATGGFVIGSIVAMHRLVDRSDFAAWMVWALLTAAVTFLFVRVARLHTEGEWRWRWGSRAETTKT